LGQVIPTKIYGIQCVPLRVIPDDRGAVLHMLRSDAPHFSSFGEVYFSEINSGIVKAWKRHLKMTQYFAVPVGRVLFVFQDNRPNSPSHGTTQEVILGRPDAYSLLIVPPMIWYGFKGMAECSSLIANCASLTHELGESEKSELSPMGYQW